MLEQVLQLLNSMGRLPDDLTSHLGHILTKKSIRKGTVVFSEGRICREIFFVAKGMLLGQKWQKGQEVTTWIMREGNIVTSPASFIGQKPSLEWVIAVEDCEVWGISWEQLQEAYRLFPIFNLHGRLLTEKYYLMSLEREEFNKRYKGKEKYMMLLKSDPELVARCPAKYLASYLNVSETTLSTIKSQLHLGRKSKKASGERGKKKPAAKRRKGKRKGSREKK